MPSKPPVWQMIKEAIEHLGGRASNAEIKKYIKGKYDDVKENTINCQIAICTVNRQARVNYAQNQKPRSADSKYDFLFSIGRGLVEIYEPEKHGIWEIRKGERVALEVAQVGQNEVSQASPGIVKESEEVEETLSFPLESHLRDFLARNLESIEVNERNLHLYVDDNDREGIEYPTDVGPIDILAVDGEGNFVVFELKLSKGADRAIGQILRYMGWVKVNLAGDKAVRGVIVAQTASHKLKYAVAVIPQVSLFDYQISFSIKPVNLHT